MLINFLRSAFNALPSLAGVLLATLALALVFVKELDEKLKDKRAVRWSLAIVLAIIGISGFVSDLVQKSQERTRTQTAEKDQGKAIDGIKDQLHQSEIQRIADTRYLEGQLKVFAEFAPAIVKLAQATELNTRKQYEAKVTSDKELYVFTMDTVKKLREFSVKYNNLQAQQMNRWMAAERQPQLTADGRQQIWNQQIQETMQTSYQRDAEFRASILPDALFARQELMKRNIPEPDLPPTEKSNADSALHGLLAGAWPEIALPNYLELMAKGLRVK
jgi:hypothetical protein